MITYILELMRRNKLMNVVESDVKKMMETAHEIFNASSMAVIDGKPVDFDLYARDREINYLVIKTRKRIVEHLSVSQTKNPIAELIFITLINNIERIGDHSKNMYDVYRKLGGQVAETKYLAEVKSIRDQVESYFPKAAKALFNDDEAMAREAMDGHLKVTKAYDKFLEEIMRDKEIDTSQAVALAIVMRSLKRVSSHLKTISTTAVNPFMLLGFREMPELEKGGKKEEE